MSRATMTRRGFLKSTAAMGAAGALGISAADSLTAVDPAHADEASDVKIIKTSCRACIASCAVLAHVRDGRVVKIEGNPESPMSQGGVCAKGLAGIQALYHPNRNKYPMRRVGERGTNQWERISWEEALTEVATKINEVSDKYGSEAISVSTGGGGNPHFSNVKRFGEAINTPNVWEPGCSQCYLPRMGASLLAYGAGKPNNLSFSDSNGWDYYYTDSPVTSLVLWGTDPSNSSVATGGRALAELRNRPEGLRTVVIDPRYTLDAAKAEVWLPIRPGTDAALLLTSDPLDPREREVRRGLLPHLDEHALPYQPRDAPHAEGDRGGLARHRCRLCGMGSREERPGGRGVPHERGALPGAVRHLRGQRHAVRHGRPAPEGVLRGVDA